MLFTAEHEEPRRSLQKFIAAEINPHVDEWEAAGQFPAHELFKKLGALGFLGLNKPVEFGGAGLDYSVRPDDGGRIGGGSQRLRANGDRRADRHGHARARPVRLGRIAPGVPCAGDFGRRGRLRRRVRAGRWLGRRRDQNQRATGRRRLRHRWRQDVDHQRRRRRIGCACSPIPETVPSIATNR